jgi:hypothetical protein
MSSPVVRCCEESSFRFLVVIMSNEEQATPMLVYGTVWYETTTTGYGTICTYGTVCCAVVSLPLPSVRVSPIFSSKPTEPGPGIG